MNKKIFLSVILIMSLSSLPMLVKANTSEPVPMESVMSEAAAKRIMLRIDEIKTMDKSHLTSLEKKNMRKELRSMKKSLSSGGIFLSAGSLLVILIVLLLVL